MIYPYQQPYQFPQSYPPAAQRQEVVKVNGENGARAYNLAPNSSVLMLDEQQPIVWLKTTDGAGYATVTPYSITPYQQEIPVDVKSLEERVKRLEEALNESNSTNIRKNDRNDEDYIRN